MTYLLAKYALVFFLAAISGFLFGRWFTRRSFVDVSESYEDLRDAATRSDGAQWNKLWARLDTLSMPKDVDLSNVTDRLDGLAYAIGNLPTPSPVNLAPVESKLEVLNKIVGGIPVPLPPKEVDLQPVTSKLDHLATQIAALPVPKEVPPVDIAPLREQLSSLDRQIRATRQPQVINLTPVDERLGAIELELGRLGRRLEVVPQMAISPVSAESAGPVTLKAASYGEKDNLRRIFGVGPMLEELLNSHGVFYFWQVANWTDTDIHVMDERLDTFKGRIDRDNWVEQAMQLSNEPGSAQQPTEVRISA